MAGSMAISAFSDDLSPSSLPPSGFVEAGFPPVVTGFVTQPSGREAAHATKVSCCKSVGVVAPAAFSPLLIAPATIVHTEI
eukprot:6949114-Prymnesium_polylepis.1